MRATSANNTAAGIARFTTEPPAASMRSIGSGSGRLSLRTPGLAAVDGCVAATEGLAVLVAETVVARPDEFGTVPTGAASVTFSLSEGAVADFSAGADATAAAEAVGLRTFAERFVAN